MLSMYPVFPKMNHILSSKRLTFNLIVKCIVSCGLFNVNSFADQGRYSFLRMDTSVHKNPSVL